MNTYLRFTRALTLSISIILLGACSSDSSKTPPADPSLSLREQLQNAADDAVRDGLPGVSLHVQRNGEHISVVSGVLNQESLEPVTPSSLFHANSIGKTFTATMVLRLISSGFLQLDDPINLWLDPSMSVMITNSDRITIRHLLSHTSGIPDYVTDAAFTIDFYEAPGKTWSPTEILAYTENLQSTFEPGADYEYSNTNTVLLGIIAERITGVPIGMALRQWVFEPAGLLRTVGVFENHGQTELSRGYVPYSVVANSGLNITLPAEGNDLDTSEWLYSEGHGDASVISTPTDLNSFIRSLVDTEILVAGDLKTQMLSEALPGSEHGLGIFINNEDALAFEHSGGGFGQISMMSYTPSEDLSFATTVNGSAGDYEDIFFSYMTQLYRIFEQAALNES